MQTAAHICDEYTGDFSKENIETEMESFIRDNGWSMGKVMNCLRLALAGSASGLGIADIVSFIGPEEFGKRMEYIEKRMPVQ